MEPLKILIVEDEALLAMELEDIVHDAGHTVVGSAVSFREATDVLSSEEPDIALVDINLSDGPTGIDVARYIGEHCRSTVVFLTANPKRIPGDFAGALGVIAKPYTVHGLMAALQYLEEGVRRPPPAARCPIGFSLSPAYSTMWG